MKVIKTRDIRPPSQIKSLYGLLAEIASEDRPNIAILTENEFLFSYKDRLSFSEFMTDHGPASGLRPVRGDVMDFFAQLEFMVNQIFVAHMMSSMKDVRKLEQLLDGIDFFQKIRFLKEWSLIENPMKEKLICLKEVRNGFAHNWEIKEVKYKGKPIIEQFNKFKKDAAVVFSALINIYNGSPVDVDRLIKNIQKQSALLNRS